MDVDTRRRCVYRAAAARGSARVAAATTFGMAICNLDWLSCKDGVGNPD